MLRFISLRENLIIEDNFPFKELSVSMSTPSKTFSLTFPRLI